MRSMPTSARIAVALLAALAACATDEATAPLPLDAPADLDTAWKAVQPLGLVDLVEAPGDLVPLEPGCPSIDFVDGIETWTGGCTLFDGTLIEGRLQLHDGPEGAWVAGEQLAVIEGGELSFYLDGAVELLADGDLLLLDAAATSCGAQGPCSEGLNSLDLRYALLPAEGGLDQGYDASVRGFVAHDGGEPATVEGAWRVDPATCSAEPIDGVFAVQLHERHTLLLDGDTACDGCAARTAQGVDAPAFCAAVTEG